MFPEEIPCAAFRLRLVRQEDAPALLRFLNRPEVIEPTSSEGWTLESLRMFGEENLAGALIGKWARYAIVQEDGMVVGSVGLFHIDARNRRGEIGYDLSPEQWGRGIMTAAAGALIDWAFAEGGFNRIEATVMVRNRRSERVLEKLRFQREATMRQYKFVRGEFRDYSMWARLAGD